jgi:hypothetical protein
VRGLHSATWRVPIERRVWAATDGLLAVSDELAALAIGAGVDAARVHVLANGVDAMRFVPRPDAGTTRRQELGSRPPGR